MRRFAQIVDELELLDLPNVRGVAYLEWGRNNRVWARLDRFLVTQKWLDQFSGVYIPLSWSLFQRKRVLSTWETSDPSAF